jgi:hypothetical protein
MVLPYVAVPHHVFMTSEGWKLCDFMVFYYPVHLTLLTLILSSRMCYFVV